MNTPSQHDLPPAWVACDSACLRLWQEDESWRITVSLVAPDNVATQRLLIRLAHCDFDLDTHKENAA